MDGIQQGLGIHTAPSTATLQHERRGDVPHTESRRSDATVLTLTSTVSGKASRAPPPGLAALYALLQNSHSAELAALPPRTTQLLSELSRHLLRVGDIGNARLRNTVLAGGLFLDCNAAHDDGADADAASPQPLVDLKSLLGQLLTLLQPGRQLALRNGALQFISLNPGTAQCLQAYAEEQKHGARQKSFQRPLLANVETAFLGIVRNQLQSLAQSSEKKTRWIMDLMLQHERGPLTVPLTLSHQAHALPETWEAEFELELRHGGPVHVVLGVKNSTVDVSIAAGRAETVDQLRAGRLTLAKILGRKGLTLGSFTCLRGQHERLAG